MKKNKNRTQGEILLHIPNPLHLDACQQGGRIFRNKKKYTRKGKARFDARKEY